MSDNFNKNRLAKNTILLYVRMLFTMWLNLYTTRLTLANLGVEDMGIYGVVGSIVSMFAVFSGGMGNAVQRFLTYEIGRDNGDPNKVFCSCLNVIFLLSGIIFILLEVGGLWFLHTKINIPAESMDAAQWVFQISVLTCIVNLISIPYNSLIVAHEKMNAFAAISILQVILTCASVYCLSYFPTGRLLIYAILMATIIRKTKCFDFWERNVLFPKTKRSFFRTPKHPLPCPFPLNFSLLIITKKFGNLAKNRYICIV